MHVQKVARHPNFRLLSRLHFASNPKVTFMKLVDLIKETRKLEGHFLIGCIIKEL